MNPKLLSKAQSRLRVATRALNDLRAAPSHQEFADTWYTFLTAAKNVYTSLEQGAKDSPQDRQWFGGIKAARKVDPLLQYLFQARDDEEHGVEAATELVPGSLRLGTSNPNFSQNFHLRSLRISGAGHIEADATSNDGKPIRFDVTPSRTVLKAVIGRGDIRYDPPRSHLGKPIPDNSPLTVADLGLSYLTSLVEEAGKRT